MSSSPLAKFPRSRIVGLLATLGLATSAQAAFVQGDWDPPYGSPFSDLGWEGTVVVEVPDACLALGDGLIVINSTTCGAAAVFDAKVRLYNLLAPTTILETLDFTTATVLTKILIQGGEVTQFEIAGIDKVGSTIPEARPGSSPFNAFFSLDISLSPTADARTASLSWYAARAESDPRGTNSTAAVVNFAPFATTTPVSAPGTLALAAAAVGLLAALRRRA